MSDYKLTIGSMSIAFDAFDPRAKGEDGKLKRLPRPRNAPYAGRFIRWGVWDTDRLKIYVYLVPELPLSLAELRGVAYELKQLVDHLSRAPNR